MRIKIIKECKVCGNKKESNNPYEQNKCNRCGGEMEIIKGEIQATLC